VKQYRMILLCVTLALVVCTSEEEAYDYDIERTEIRTWSALGINQISVSTHNGAITASATQDTMITAEITRRCSGTDSIDAEEHIDDIEINEYIAFGELTLEAEMPSSDGRNYQGAFDITTPPSKYLKLITVNGDILVQDMINGARLRTINGAIAIEDLRGSINGGTVNGAIYCVMAELTANESVNFGTTNGEVTLLLPSDVSADFEAWTTSGDVTITGFSVVTYTTNLPNHKAGTIGSVGGNAVVDIDVAIGNITIQAN